MQRKTSAAIWLAGAFFACGPALAADIDQAGADKLKSGLTHYLPKDLAENGFLTVKPGAGRYEITMDLMRLIGEKIPADVKVMGLKPFSMSATPAEQDRWKVEGEGDLDVSAEYKVENAPGSLRYSIDNYNYSGILDPALAYFRSATFTASGLAFTSVGGPDAVDAHFGSVNYVMSSADAPGGALDFTATGAMTDFRENVTTKDAPPVEISADSIAFDASVKGAMLREIRGLVVFVLDHMDQKQLTAEQQKDLKGRVLAALPLATSIDENVRLANLNVGTPLGAFGFKGVDYGLSMSGLTEATRFGISVKAREPQVPDGLVPAAYAPLLPAETEVSFSFKDMNLGGFLKDVIETADFTKDTPLSDTESAALASRIFPDGKLTMTFDRIAARSEAYDFEMTGVLTTALENTKQVSMTATLMARDFDRTIAFVREAAKSDPELNQVSLGMMMAKGFAKTDADGTQRWDVVLNEDGSVSVNGQQIKGPDAQDSQEDDALPDDGDDSGLLDEQGADGDRDILKNSAPDTQE